MSDEKQLFKAIKIDLVLVFFVGVLAILVTGKLISTHWLQILVLAVYSISAAFWMFLRVKKILFNAPFQN